MTTLFDTTDLDTAQHMLHHIYGAQQITVSGERCRLRLIRERLGSVEIHRTTFGMSLDVEGGPFGSVPIGHVLDGRVLGRHPSGPDVHGKGDTFLLAWPGERYRGRVENADLEIAFLDQGLFGQVAAPEPGRDGLRFIGHRPVSPQAAALWLNTFAYVRDLAGAAVEPLVTGNAARLLAAAALAAFPSTARRDPSASDRRDAHPAALRRAVAFIDDNAGRDICAAEIAAAAHVTVRTLQLAFRRHLDTTPTMHLRRVRLDHVHRALVSADPAVTTVAAVAARWGFAHHSRFAAQYREAYGRSPSRTLRE